MKASKTRAQPAVATTAKKAIAKPKAVAKQAKVRVKAEPKAKTPVKKTVAVKKETAAAGSSASRGSGSDTLAGKNVCFTSSSAGKLFIPRAIASAAVIVCGGSVSKKIGKKLDILVHATPWPDQFIRKYFMVGPNVELWTEERFRAAVTPFFALPN